MAAMFPALNDTRKTPHRISALSLHFSLTLAFSASIVKEHGRHNQLCGGAHLPCLLGGRCLPSLLLLLAAWVVSLFSPFYLPLSVPMFGLLPPRLRTIFVPRGNSCAEFDGMRLHSTDDYGVNRFRLILIIPGSLVELRMKKFPRVLAYIRKKSSWEVIECCPS